MKIGPDLDQDEKETVRRVSPIQERSRWEKGARELTGKSMAGQTHWAQSDRNLFQIPVTT